MAAMKLSLDRENILEFNVDIQGYANTSTTNPPQVRLFLEQKNIGRKFLYRNFIQLLLEQLNINNASDIHKLNYYISESSCDFFSTLIC